MMEVGSTFLLHIFSVKCSNLEENQQNSGWRFWLLHGMNRINLIGSTVLSQNISSLSRYNYTSNVL